MMSYKPFIGGTWYESGPTVTIQSPFDNQPVSRVGFVDADGVEAAIQAAERGFRIIRAMERYQRAEILQKMAAGITSRRDAMADAICAEGGKPIQLAAEEVKRAAEACRFAAHACLAQKGESFLPSLTEDQAGFYGVSQRFPIGPTASIETSSAPLGSVVSKVAPALAAGVSLVVKPASQTPSAALQLADVAAEAGLPSGVLNVIPLDRETTAALVADERIKLLFFAGRPATGWEMKSAAGTKRVALELGGNAAAIIEPDADLDYALPRLAAAAFANAGQTAGSVQRILVRKSVYEEVELRMLELAQNRMRTGNPADKSVMVGPMISAEAADRVMDWIEEALQSGATMLTGGERRGNMIPPTLLADASPSRRVRQEPVFGPVVVVGSYETFSQAITEVNRLDSGLRAGVFTRDLSRAFRAFQEMVVGTVTINDFPPHNFDHVPHGGINDTGCGRHGIHWAMEEMTELRVMAFNLI